MPELLLPNFSFTTASEPAVFYGIVGGSVVLVLLLLLGIYKLLGSRGARKEEAMPAPEPAQEPPDEITQPLPVAIRPHVLSSSTASIRAAARTDKGRARSGSVNEDDTLLAELADETGEVRTGLYAVADGMGGHQKGEVASRTAIEATISALQSHPFFANGDYLRDGLSDETVLDVVREAVSSANRAVYGVKVDQGTDMGTTLVLAMVLRSKAYVANIGDSRAYLLRDGSIRQLTEDHSLVERMVASGQITEAEARLHPQRNLIFRSLGTDPQVEVDMFVERLQPGDRLLLCSDGLTNMVPDAVLSHIASREENLDMACRLMIRTANEAGGRDNISVVLAEVLSPEDAAW